MTKIKLFLIVFSLGCASLLYSQTIRGPVKGNLKMSHAVRSETGDTVHLYVETLAGIVLDADNPLIQGIELKITIPREINQHRNSFGLYLFKGVSPVPVENIDSYRGIQTFMRLIPQLDTLFIIIPLTEDHTLKQDVNTFLIPVVLKKKDFPLILTIQPVAKALPDYIYNAEFIISMKPIYSPKGNLSLVIRNPEKVANLEIRVDGVLIDLSENTHTFPAGVHVLDIYTPDTGHISRNFIIEPGQTTEIVHEIVLTQSVLTVDIPSGIPVYLDSEPIIFGAGEKKKKLSPGDHQIMLQFGEYKLIKDFTVKPGENINLSIFFDLRLEKY